MTIRLRFAPSPTGELHVGNARTAIFNWLYVKKHAGSLIIRIEDTDEVRSQRRFEQLIYDNLKWLGLDWQEGPDVGGPFGPYRQSDRIEIYLQHAQTLLNQGLAYRCFCSEQELGKQSERARQLGLSWKYPGTCHALSAREVESRLTAGNPSVIRLKVRSGMVLFHDLVHGDMRFDSKILGDPILIRSSGLPTYNYAVVVDDALMKITHVIRGDDHLSNTPRQVLIYEALSFPIPAFVHLSTILGSDRTRLSKRHGATSILYFREQGVLSEALLNYLTLLGWSPKEGQGEILTRDELIENFDLGRVSKSQAIFDVSKLNFFSRQYLQRSDRLRIIKMAISYLQREGLLGSVNPAMQDWVGLLVEAFLPGMDRISEISSKARELWSFDGEAAVKEEGVRKVLCIPGATTVVDELNNQLSISDRDVICEWPLIVQAIKTRSGLRGKKLFHPIRVALTGRDSGPELDKLVSLFERGSNLDLPQKIKSCETRVSEFIRAMKVQILDPEYGKP